MRISDWNSDVCSSDLTRRRQLPTAGTADRSRKADPRLSRQRRFEQGNSAPYFRLRKHRQVSLEEHLLEARRQQSPASDRSEEHTSELQSLMRISYAVFCLKKKKYNKNHVILTTLNNTVQSKTVYTSRSPRTKHTT